MADLRAHGSQGKLVLCPTPLGNLDDITLRVLHVLREADLIFAEDTRVTKNLLRHFEIDTPLRSFHERAESARLRQLRELLSSGKTVAMVTDAGMPGISDPGGSLVRAARECGAPVEVLPGPSAVPSAIVLSGFDVSTFRFDGFLPRKPTARRDYLASLEREEAAVVWFEAPTRIDASLRDIAAVLPSRRIFVLREYTKQFEQHMLGTADEVRSALSTPARGEFTVVLEGARVPVSTTPTLGDARQAVAFLRGLGLSAKDCAEAVRLATGLSRNELYRLALQTRERHD
jgi:16S rRNA (cytidine1402-2'-O)-methyltransferase